MEGFPMIPELQDYIRLAITLIFLGIFTYEVVSGHEVNPIVERYLIVFIGFWFGLDRLGDFAGKFITKKKAVREYNKRLKEG